MNAKKLSIKLAFLDKNVVENFGIALFSQAFLSMDVFYFENELFGRDGLDLHALQFDHVQGVYPPISWIFSR